MNRLSAAMNRVLVCVIVFGVAGCAPDSRVSDLDRRVTEIDERLSAVELPGCEDLRAQRSKEAANCVAGLKQCKLRTGACTPEDDCTVGYEVGDKDSGSGGAYPTDPDGGGRPGDAVPQTIAEQLKRCRLVVSWYDEGNEMCQQELRGCLER